MINIDEKHNSLKLKKVEFDNHDEFKKATLEKAREIVSAYPDLLKKIENIFTTYSPPEILSALCFYGTTGFILDTGEKIETSTKIQQHDCELLQAFVLTIPVDKWGDKPLNPDILETVSDLTLEVSNVFYMKYILSGELTFGDDKKNYERFILNGICMHTHTVRNWAYSDQVIQTSRDLYTPLDENFRKAHSFSVTDLIDTLLLIQSKTEKKMSNQTDSLKKVLDGKTPEDLVDRYFKFMVDNNKNNDEILSHLPINRKEEEEEYMQTLGVIMTHFDRETIEAKTFTIEEIINLTGKSKEIIYAIFDALSLRPGDLKNSDHEHFFLDNPIWEKPMISLDNKFLVPLPQVVFSHIHRIIDNLAHKGNFETILQNRRAVYLENKLKDIFKKALPNAKFYPSFKWKQNNQQFENDLVVVVDHIVIIAEAKSHYVHQRSLRGSSGRVKQYVKDTILKPSVQSYRLEKFIADARSGDKDANKILTEKGIKAEEVDQVIRISVNLYNLPTISEVLLKKIGWIPEDHPVAPSILINDLYYIADILDNPILFMHYLSERFHIQKLSNILGDELDLLGTYMNQSSGFESIIREECTINISGMSTQIDEYYEAMSEGIKKSKPKMHLCPTFYDIINRRNCSPLI